MPPLAPRDFGLNRVQCARLQEHLQPGEQLRWAGRPVGRSFEPDWVNRVVGVFFFLPFGLLGAAQMYFLAAEGQPADSLIRWVLSWLMAIIFFMIPIIAFIIVPLVHAAGLRRRVYVITNRRAIVCGREMEFWPLEPDMVFSNEQAKDGCGKLVFGLREGKSVGFMDIRDVRLVEEKLEQAIAERENA